MQGKVCIVTGATAGIGEITALELARKGATVVIISRSQAKCQATVDRIRAETGNPNVDYLVADLSSQASIRAVAAAFREKYDRLDVLVNNAGMFMARRQESVDGIEQTWALNHLGYFLLTYLLRDMLVGTGVTANSLHPGFVASNFAMNNMTGIMAVLRPAFRLMQKFTAISSEKGAETSIYLASSPEVEGVTGKYFYKSKAVTPSRAAQDMDVAKRLWAVSEEMVGV